MFKMKYMFMYISRGLKMLLNCSAEQNIKVPPSLTWCFKLGPDLGCDCGANQISLLVGILSKCACVLKGVIRCLGEKSY